MKILIYAFKPFKEYKENISKKVVEGLKEKNFKKVILPVVPHAMIILNHIKRTKPDIILGIGQCGRGKFIRIERRTKNIYKSEKSKTEKKIRQHSPRQYLLNLKLEKIPGTRISYNAGKYVCNFTMYTIMDWVRKNRLPIRFAFIHIPKNYNPQKATKIIINLMRKLT